MNTLAELIRYHKICAETERIVSAQAEQRGHKETAEICRRCMRDHDAAVATLQRAVADIERLQKAREATR